jgi:hypothetical protein
LICWQRQIFYETLARTVIDIVEGCVDGFRQPLVIVSSAAANEGFLFLYIASQFHSFLGVIMPFFILIIRSLTLEILAPFEINGLMIGGGFKSNCL